jgi:DNA-binding transcriptional regulator YdaS (Cro superfamily)
LWRETLPKAVETISTIRVAFRRGSLYVYVMSQNANTSGLDMAIAKAGGAPALAKLLGLERSTVYLWRKGRVPAERVPEIEAKVGIARHQLRPDLWPAPVVAA